MPTRVLGGYMPEGGRTPVGDVAFGSGAARVNAGGRGGAVSLARRPERLGKGGDGVATASEGSSAMSDSPAATINSAPATTATTTSACARRFFTRTRYLVAPGNYLTLPA